MVPGWKKTDPPPAASGGAYFRLAGGTMPFMRR